MTTHLASRGGPGPGKPYPWYLHRGVPVNPAWMVSPVARPVEWHLRQVFTTLGITSLRPVPGQPHGGWPPCFAVSFVGTTGLCWHDRAHLRWRSHSGHALRARLGTRAR